MHGGERQRRRGHVSGRAGVRHPVRFAVGRAKDHGGSEEARERRARRLRQGSPIACGRFGNCCSSDRRRGLEERIQRVRSSRLARTEGKQCPEILPSAGVEFDRRDTYPNVDIVIELQTPDRRRSSRPTSWPIDDVHERAAARYGLIRRILAFRVVTQSAASIGLHRLSQTSSAAQAETRRQAARRLEAFQHP